MKYIQLIYLYLIMAYTALWQSRRWTKNVFSELRRVGVLTGKEDEKRIRFYLIQSLVTGRWVQALRDYGPTTSEKKTLQTLGAITPLVDDLTDNERRYAATFFSDAPVPQEHLALNYLYRSLMKDAPGAFKRLVEETLAAQDESLVQLDEKSIGFEKLKQVTESKGGGATLLYRLALTNPPTPDEAAAFRSLGYVLQLVNDLFDVHKDISAGQQTLVTACRSLALLRTEYHDAVDQMTVRFLKLNYDPSRIHRCLLLISTITSRGEVCLAQFEKLAGNNDTWDPRKYTRSELVCDMEKPANIMASVRFSRQFYNRFK